MKIKLSFEFTREKEKNAQEISNIKVIKQPEMNFSVSWIDSAVYVPIYVLLQFKISGIELQALWNVISLRA